MSGPGLLGPEVEGARDNAVIWPPLVEPVSESGGLWKEAAVRTVGEIRRELDELATRRTALWEDLSAVHDSAKAADVAKLSDRIDRLWLEPREARVRHCFGPPDRILARARLDANVERLLRRAFEAAGQAG